MCKIVLTNNDNNNKTMLFKKDMVLNNVQCKVGLRKANKQNKHCLFNLHNSVDVTRPYILKHLEIFYCTIPFNYLIN